MKEKIQLVSSFLIWGSMGLFVRYINMPSGATALFSDRRAFFVAGMRGYGQPFL